MRTFFVEKYAMLANFEPMASAKGVGGARWGRQQQTRDAPTDAGGAPNRRAENVV